MTTITPLYRKLPATTERESFLTEAVELISEAITEIVNLDDRSNPVVSRLVKLRDELEAQQ